MAHRERDTDQGLEAYTNGRLSDSPIYLYTVLKRHFDGLAQVSVETDGALSSILVERDCDFGERHSAGVAADLDDVIDANVCLRHGGRIKKGKALAIVFGETAIDG